MNTTPEMVKVVMEDRERAMRDARLARIAACFRACRMPSTFDRLARALRLAPEPC